MGHKARDPHRETSRHRLRMAPGMHPNTSMLRRSVIQHSIVSTFSQVLIRTCTVGARHAPGNAQQCKPGHHRLYWLSQGILPSGIYCFLLICCLCTEADDVPCEEVCHDLALTILTARPRGDRGRGAGRVPQREPPTLRCALSSAPSTTISFVPMCIRPPGVPWKSPHGAWPS